MLSLPERSMQEAWPNGFTMRCGYTEPAAQILQFSVLRLWASCSPSLSPTKPWIPSADNGGNTYFMEL